LEIRVGPGKPDWMPNGQPADLVAGYIVKCLVTGETEVTLHPDIAPAEV
jgi:hypothetical protein